jgi:hypothetical protein
MATPALFPSLSTLATLSADFSSTLRTIGPRTCFLCYQHLLPTTGTLLSMLVRHGVPAENIFAQGKCYSTIAQVVDELHRMRVWANAGSRPSHAGGFDGAAVRDVHNMMVQAKSCLRKCENVVLLDDGGWLLANGVFSEKLNVIGIDQTASGRSLLKRLKLPIIDVARSAAKRILEPPIITKAILSAALRHPAVRDRSKFGVVGLGFVGQSLARCLVRTYRRQISLFDVKRMEPLILGHKWCDSIEELIERCDVVLGCTGADIMEGTHIPASNSGHRVFASCSSGDREFRSLLLQTIESGLAPVDPLADIIIPNSDTVILRGGFPLNFDGTREHEAADEIEITRCLLFSGIVQALTSLNAGGCQNRRYKLSAELQSRVALKWLACRDVRENGAMDWSDLNWINDQSEGAFVSNEL